MHLTIIALINAAELISLNTMFCLKMDKRKYFVLKCLGLLAVFLAYAFGASLEKTKFFFHAPIIILSFLYVLLCYQLPVRSALFIWLAAYAIQRGASMVNSMAMLLMPERVGHYGDGDYHMIPLGFVLILVSDIIVYALAYIFFIRRVKAVDISRNATIRVLILTGIVLLLNQLWAIGVDLYGDEYVSSTMSAVEYLWTFSTSILCLGIQFGMIESGEKDRELEITRHMISEQEQQYKMSKSNIEAINRKCHDLKHLRMEAERDSDGSRSYLDEAMAIVDSFDTSIHTGNETLDVIFTEKNQYCKNHEIEFVAMIDGEKLAFMEPVDQYVLFGNMIDNAIGAVRKVDDHGKRSIYIDVHAQQQLLLIKTENHFTGELEFEDGLPHTTTGDTFNHGYGMRSIRLIAEKYKGSASARAEDGVFYLSVVIPLPSM